MTKKNIFQAKEVRCIEAADAAEALADLSLEDQKLAMSHLPTDEQVLLMESLIAEEAADILENLPDAQAADILEDMPSEAAADIVEALPGTVGADVLWEMQTQETEALLAELDDPEEAEKLRTRAEYPWDTAGGLMRTSFASFSEKATVGDVFTNWEKMRNSTPIWTLVCLYHLGCGRPHGSAPATGPCPDTTPEPRHGCDDFRTCQRGCRRQL